MIPVSPMIMMIVMATATPAINATVKEKKKINDLYHSSKHLPFLILLNVNP